MYCRSGAVRVGPDACGLSACRRAPGPPSARLPACRPACLASCPPCLPPQVLHDSDVNGNGTLDYEEWLAATLATRLLEREDLLHCAFTELDKV